jgi:hypothetical protein
MRVSDLLGVEKEEIMQMADNRKTTRIKHPGLRALNCETSVDMITERVMGRQQRSANRGRRSFWHAGSMFLSCRGAGTKDLARAFSALAQTFSKFA